MGRARALLGTVAVSVAVVCAPTARAAVVVPGPLGYLHVHQAPTPAALAQIVDSRGREVLLRGINAPGLRDDYQANGTLQPPYPEIPDPYLTGCPSPNDGVYFMPVCAQDGPQMASFGYDVVRLPVSWSLIEPRPGVIGTAYLDRIAQVVSWLATSGIYTVLDMHQDAWSKYLYTPAGASCPPLTQPIRGFHEADGAPLWASAHLAPVCALEGVRDLDAAVQEDFQRLYSDLPGPDGVGLQEHYARAVAALARRFADDPAVAGYELLNEPEPGYLGPTAMDPVELFPFYAKVIAAVRASVHGFRQLFFIEPDVARDLTDRSFILTPWSGYSSYRNVVYAPHVYTSVFTLDAELHQPVLAPLFPANGGYDSAAQDARILGLPLWVGEFGGPVEADQTVLRAQYTNQDRLGVGGALWFWKGFRSSDWSVLYDDSSHTDAVYPSRRQLTDRAYPIYTAGRLESLHYDPVAGSFELRAFASAVRPGDTAAATVIYIPAAAGGAVTATGAGLVVVPLGDGAREAFVYPVGGAYRVSG